MNEIPGFLEKKYVTKNKSIVVLCPIATGKFFNHHLGCTLELGKKWHSYRVSAIAQHYLFF